MLHTTVDKGLKGALFGRNASVSLDRSSPLTSFLMIMLYESEATAPEKIFGVNRFEFTITFPYVQDAGMYTRHPTQNQIYDLLYSNKLVTPILMHLNCI